MISLLLISLEGMFNAAMDTLDDHYSTSIFTRWEKTFWSKNDSWTRKDTLPEWIPDTFTDGWHLVKFLHICSFLLAIVFYERIFEWWILDFLLFGIARNTSFSIFYNKILIK